MHNSHTTTQYKTYNIEHIRDSPNLLSSPWIQYNTIQYSFITVAGRPLWKWHTYSSMTNRQLPCRTVLWEVLRLVTTG